MLLQNWMHSTHQKQATKFVNLKDYVINSKILTTYLLCSSIYHHTYKRNSCQPIWDWISVFLIKKINFFCNLTIVDAIKLFKEA